jgi:cbb3-type cytochrome oxidase subunit 3
MKQAVLSQFNIDWIPLTGLLIFVACFSLYVFFTYKKSNKKFYEQVAQIPLEDGVSSSQNAGGK